MTELKENSFSFDKTSIKNFNRKQAYESKNAKKKSVSNLLSMHNIMDIKIDVGREIAWFNQTKLKPEKVPVYPDNDCLFEFKRMLWNSPVGLDIPKLSMSPNTLAQLCCKRLLTSDHIIYFSKLLNESQESSHVVYLNYVRDIKTYFSKLQPNFEYIIYVVNVGNGCTPYIGSDTCPGNHWTIAVYSKAMQTLLYCDSLGWDAPTGFLEKVEESVSIVFNDKKVITCTICHDPEIHKYSTKCGMNCLRYPFQTCGNICGPISLIMAAIVAFKPHFFNDYVKLKSTHGSYIYLQDPTKYSGYLRLVLCAWYSSNKVDIDFVIPKCEQVEPNEIDDARAENAQKSLKKLETAQLGNLVCPACFITFTKKVKFFPKYIHGGPKKQVQNCTLNISKNFHFTF